MLTPLMCSLSFCGRRTCRQVQPSCSQLQVEPIARQNSLARIGKVHWTRIGSIAMATQGLSGAGAKYVVIFDGSPACSLSLQLHRSSTASHTYDSAGRGWRTCQDHDCMRVHWTSQLYTRNSRTGYEVCCSFNLVPFSYTFLTQPCSLQPMHYVNFASIQIYPCRYAQAHLK